MGRGYCLAPILLAIWPYRERPLLVEGLFATRKPATEPCRSWPTDLAEGRSGKSQELSRRGSMASPSKQSM